MLRDRTPNFFRPFLNPDVARACLALGRLVDRAWPGSDPGDYQSFLANSVDEALSGAIKLARFGAGEAGRPTDGLVVDRSGRLGPFASVDVAGGTVTFVPGLTVVRTWHEVDTILASGTRFGLVVVLYPSAEDATGLPSLQQLCDHGATVIACVDRASLATAPPLLRPEVVVFDESFVHHEVPFAAFTASRRHFAPWNQPGRSAFHSTTFQPNTISCKQLLRCLQHDEPDLCAVLERGFACLGRDPARVAEVFARQFSPFLARAIRALGLEGASVCAEGHYIVADGRRVFDGVAGVACSMRGHHPSNYLAELDELESPAASRNELGRRLADLTGLVYWLPAVSGASAVEAALRLALAAQFPRQHVLALRGGFGGKTLLALTGTAKDSYKTHIGPLYEQVTYLDPFADDALAVLEEFLTRVPVAVVQLELIQAVGGVRPVPEPVVRYLAENRERHGYWLLVDEVQTGMYRTGPFTRSAALGLAPDLLALGKGTSDMMFPCALTLYSEAVHRRLMAVCPELPGALRRRCDYDDTARTVLNVLRWADGAGVSAQVAASGVAFADGLRRRLADCAAVREVRAHGLLIGIELSRRGVLRRRLASRVTGLPLLALLRHEPFPLFLGFCQYEPHVLKLTPPLTVTPEEVERICDAIAAVLHRPLSRLLVAGLGSLTLGFLRRLFKKTKGETS